VTLCFEGISELAATEIEDEQLWDGQARSSRYQDFSRSGFVTPPEFDEQEAAFYRDAAGKLIEAYNHIHAASVEYLTGTLPRPEGMKQDAYQRNIAARAFDIARYLLFFGIPTGVGQVTSIRTLEKQIRRLKSSEYLELRSLADEIAECCAAPPECTLDGSAAVEPLAPTLARHVDTDTHALQSRQDLLQWANENLEATPAAASLDVDLVKPSNVPADIVATLLYTATDRPFRQLYEMACGWSSAKRAEVIDVACRSRTRRDELLRSFRGGLYAFDIVMDIGAYRDLHRHRRCQQFRQAYTSKLGYSVPGAIEQSGLLHKYQSAMQQAMDAADRLPAPGAHYLLPFAARSRFLFKMDFAEAEYVSRLRSGVKGHSSYREVAWKMKQKMEEVEPELGRLIQATPPWIEDPLTR
jgi:thymidylate synthase ThyX